MSAPYSFDDYQADTKRTAAAHLSVGNDRFILAALGLAGETGEFVETVQRILFSNEPLDPIHLIEELGDVLWYISAAGRALNIRLQDFALASMVSKKLSSPLPSDIYTFEDYQLDVNHAAPTDLQGNDLLNFVAMGLSAKTSEYADTVKKVIFQDHVIDEPRLIGNAADTLFYIALACQALDTTLSGVALANIAKLARRYPNGFTPEASRNRTA